MRFRALRPMAADYGEHMRCEAWKLQSERASETDRRTRGFGGGEGGAAARGRVGVSGRRRRDAMLLR